MPTFKRAPLQPADEVFQPLEAGPEDEAAPTHAPAEPGSAPHQLWVRVTEEELDMLLEAVQLARYPEKARPVLPLATFDRLGELRAKLESAREG